MTPSSSKWSNRPAPLTHIECGSKWEVYSIEWPPKIVVCTGCRAVLRLNKQDPKNKKITYRRIASL